MSGHHVLRHEQRLPGPPAAVFPFFADAGPTHPRFVDAQLSGPYKLWHHTHQFEPDGAGGTVMRDTVRYALPFGPLGEVARRLIVARDLEAIFDFRAEHMAQSLT
jgi:ligand-binding SRPBCC domain-containing protein